MSRAPAVARRSVAAVSPMRRQAERRLVRLQARLEAQWGDRWIPPIAAVIVTGALFWLGTARVRSLDTGLDLAGYSQAIWLLGEGYRPDASLFGSDVNVVELHWAFVLYPLGLAATVLPAVELLVFAQAVALGAAVVPLWFLARHVAHLRIGASVGLLVGYGLHPAMHGLALDDVHPEVLAVPAFIGLAWAGATKRWILYWLAVAVVLLARADLGLALALWGFLLLGDGERRAGLWTLGVGAVWALGWLLVAQPIISDSTARAGGYGVYGNSLADVFVTVVTNPVDFVGDLFAQSNVEFVVAMLAPVLFLPLLSFRHVAPALPLAGLFLVVDAGGEAGLAERSALLLAFTMIASAHALNRLGSMGVDRVFLDIRVLQALFAASLLSFVAASPASPYTRPWSWSERDATDRAIIAATADLDEHIAVSASPSALVTLSERRWLYELDSSGPPIAARAVNRVNAVLLVDRDIPLEQFNRDDYIQSMSQAGFEITFDDRTVGVTLFRGPEPEICPLGTTCR